MKNNSIKNLEKALKINFKDKKLLTRSLIHKSFDKDYNNEKLEFLGDRVIGLIISKRLLAMYPDEKRALSTKNLQRL